MSDFVELPNGRLINTQAIRDFDPARSNRVNYINGSYELIAPEHGEVLKQALTTEADKPKAPRGRKKKTDDTDK